MAEENLPFPVTMRGYDREAVAAHISRLEESVREATAAAENARRETQQARSSLARLLD